MNFSVFPLTPDRWPALEELFGNHGACNGCWCMYWRIGAGYHKRDRDNNKKEFKKIVKKGPSPGLIAFYENKAVGWCQLTQRNSLAWFENVYPGEPAEEDTLLISCFYVRRGFKRKGVSTALIKEAINYATRINCKLIEAYPQDSASSFTGHKSSFLKAGFTTVEKVKLNRTYMRLDLK